MSSPAEIKRLKQLFINDMYAIVRGRFGVLIDTYGIAQHYGLDPNTLAMIIEYWEAKGFIATYEGTFYASLTLKGVESLESGTPQGCENVASVRTLAGSCEQSTSATSEKKREGGRGLITRTTSNSQWRLLLSPLSQV